MLILDEQGVTQAQGDSEERLAWTDLVEVSLVTTAGGPLADEVLFVLVGASGSLVVSSSDPQAQRLLERLQGLPGFRSEQVVEAMSSREPGRFVCWSAPAAPPPAG